MDIALITGSSGLIGGEAVEFFHNKFDKIVGIDNNLRKYFFGIDGDTIWNKNRLILTYKNFDSKDIDIRDFDKLKIIFEQFNKDIKLVIHTAAQPSHDWAANEPITDFTVNAQGTLNLLELTRKYCPDATFIFTSTNKVYGDRPNELPLIELENRWELDETHYYFKKGIDEKMSIDDSKHSLFGASKLAADIMVQEYGKYFQMKTVVFRGGCLSGPNHSGAKLHGFLSYLMKCCINKNNYTIFGYLGKQVRDNIHSYDLVNMFWHFYKSPKFGEVYNAGGSRHSNCSILEAIRLCENITGNKMVYSYSKNNRMGDHIWYISDISKFQEHYPNFKLTYNLEEILFDIYSNLVKR